MTAWACPPVAFLALSVLIPQEGVRIRKPPERTSVRATNFDAGDGEEVDLATLANDIGSYDKKHVRTRGTLRTVVSLSRELIDLYVLSAGRAHVLIVPGYGILREELQELINSEVRVRGIVRMLGSYIPEDLDLPPLPPARPELPRVSLTVLAISVSRRPSSDVEGGLTRQILAEPERFAGKPIRILGQFRGRNLFGDLPEDSRRGAGDWVLKDGKLALWVTGRAPKGRGFTLNPEYEGDATRWLEVEGKPEVLNGVVYLRASKVMLAPRRKDGH